MKSWHNYKMHASKSRSKHSKDKIASVEEDGKAAKKMLGEISSTISDLEENLREDHTSKVDNLKDMNRTFQVAVEKTRTAWNKVLQGSESLPPDNTAVEDNCDKAEENVKLALHYASHAGLSKNDRAFVESQALTLKGVIQFARNASLSMSWK